MGSHQGTDNHVFLSFAAPYLFDTEQRKLVELEQIIGFDPYMKLGENILRSIYRNGRLDHNLLHQISLCYPEKGEHFEHIFFGNSSR